MYVKTICLSLEGFLGLFFVVAWGFCLFICFGGFCLLVWFGLVYFPLRKSIKFTPDNTVKYSCTEKNVSMPNMYHNKMNVENMDTIYK